MILFFHFICLLARYLVTNISKSISKGKIFANVEDGDISSSSQSSESTKIEKSYSEESVYTNGIVKFFPPVYIQRYETVISILNDAAFKETIQKVADFGCSELGFFVYLKKLKAVTEILEIDINSEILKKYSYKAAPLTSDYLMSKCQKPLDVYVLAGNIAEYDDYLLGTDVVIAIELIEHLSEDAFENMPYNIFYRVKPKLAIFTTPNADFNPLFPNFTGFRHIDHKFEWTRKEFFTWTQKIITEYPEYSVRFYGIGAGPPGTENLGCCTQMAVFERSEDMEPFSTARENLLGVHTYKLIEHYKYPLFKDKRTTEEKIIHEVKYQMSNLIYMTDDCYDEESECFQIPLSFLKEFVTELCPDDKKFREILEKNGMMIKIINDSWFLIYNKDEDHSSDNYEDEDLLNEDLDNVQVMGDNTFLEENWDIVEDKLQVEELLSINITDKTTSADDLISEETKRSYSHSVVCVKDYMTEPKMSDYSQSSNNFEKTEPPKDLSITCQEKKTRKIKLSFNKSKIPRRSFKVSEDNLSATLQQISNIVHVGKPFRKISKSCSLDSCLENINCKPFESESQYLNLSPLSGGSMPFRDGDSLSFKRNKHVMNDSGSSLFSSSLDRAVDSGYPISFSPPDADMTPEQVDELFTENGVMSRSTSASSEVDVAAAINPRNRDLFVEVVVVENGDLANNNRDGEGNNVEGLVGQRLVNERLAERDPNDNMFFPEFEEFPPWLLNLGELAIPQNFILLENNDEGVEDDSSSDFNQSIDQDDADFYYEDSSVR